MITIAYPEAVEPYQRFVLDFGAHEVQFHRCGHWCQDVKIMRQDLCCVCIKSTGRCGICAHNETRMS